MKPSVIKEIHQTDLASVWFENGIVHTVSKHDVVIDKNSLSELYEKVRAFGDGKKVCWLSDITKGAAPGREGRDFAGEEGEKFIKALALVAKTFMSQTIAEIFVLVKKPTYPTRIFTTEKEAREWLKQYVTFSA